MESFFIRYRNLLVLLGILLAQIIGLGRAGAPHRRGAQHARCRGHVERAADPHVGQCAGYAPGAADSSSKLGTVDFWQNYIDLRHVREQNKDLQQTIDRLRLEQAALLEDARQGQRLQAMLDFQQKYIYKTVAAQAIGSSGSDQSHVFYIDKGADDHLGRTWR